MKKQTAKTLGAAVLSVLFCLCFAANAMATITTTSASDNCSAVRAQWTWDPPGVVDTETQTLWAGSSALNFWNVKIEIVSYNDPNLIYDVAVYANHECNYASETSPVYKKLFTGSFAAINYDEYSLQTTIHHPGGDCDDKYKVDFEYIDPEDGPTEIYFHGFHDCPVAVTLASFEAEPGNGEVTLKWETSDETDNLGFNIYRSESEDGEYVKINDSIILSKVGTGLGTTYQFVDGTVDNLKTYYYKLEDVDTFGVSTLHPVASATPRFIYAIFPQ